jgi:putative chitinase
MTFSDRKFFDACRAGIMGPTLDNNEVSGASRILEAMANTPISWCAYALATAWHETAFTMQPIKEYGGPRYFTEMYDVKGKRPTLARNNGNVNPGDGAKFFGRGYVQLTWRSNYRRAGVKIGVDLENTPDSALNPDVAAKIMRFGMQDGWFTGKSFATYLPASGQANEAQFVQARRIINGVDKAAKIAKYAMQFQAALAAGEWS